MNCSLIKTTVSLALIVVSSSSTESAKGAQDYGFFEKEIRPLFVKHCYECHSADAEKLKANLYLDSRAGWETGGDSGPAIIPGNPEASLLFETVSDPASDLKMPPKTRLSESEIGALQSWIAMGAPDPREGKVKKSRSRIDMEKGRDFWSFRPPVDPPLPSVKNPSWSEHPIDRFILAALEEEGLEPSGDATRRTLLRRIYYDLTGLPPSPEEISAFLADSSPHALETVVDDLLSRPEFGERWGRHWLDVARFAESSGGGRSMVFTEAWRYRDYVIDSFNSDKPYDRFIREQIAGDVLPWDSPEQRNDQLIGSGYLTLGAINYELQDRELLKTDFVDEQIDTLGSTFLGMTLGCAKCHDHKFDPIPTTDYYALAGIFQSTVSNGEGEVSGGISALAVSKLAGSDPRAVAKQEEKIETISTRISTIKQQLGVASRRGSLSVKDLPGVVIDSSSAELVGEWKLSRGTRRWIGDGYLHDDREGKGEKSATFSAALPASGNYEVLVAYTPHQNRSQSTPVTVHHADGETVVEIDQTKTPTRFGCFVSLGMFPFSEGSPAEVMIRTTGTNGVVTVDAVSFAAPVAEDIAKLVGDAERAEAEIRKLKSEKSKAESALRTIQPVVMAPRESDTLADSHVHIRGQLRNKGELVPRGFITVAMPEDVVPTIAENSSGRLELANWIASPDNPLTARIFVNRVWKHLLGKGIVRTPDNFGRTGDLPSHPELLDYLALQLVENGWSMKSIIREIALSRTYQLATHGNEDLDPENRLFSRANRKRLEAESIRDTVLLVSGQLDRERGGFTIRNPKVYDADYEFQSNRRSVYVPWFRTSILDLFEVFDAANPNLVVGERATTNLPTQALFLMNSPFIRTQSEHAAQRLIDEGASVEKAYEFILGRKPSASEAASMESFLSQFPVGEEEEAWTQICQTLFSCLDFRFLD